MQGPDPCESSARLAGSRWLEMAAAAIAAQRERNGVAFSSQRRRAAVVFFWCTALAQCDVERSGATE